MCRPNCLLLKFVIPTGAGRHFLRTVSVRGRVPHPRFLRVGSSIRDQKFCHPESARALCERYEGSAFPLSYACTSASYNVLAVTSTLCPTPSKSNIVIRQDRITINAKYHIRLFFAIVSVP